MILAPAYLEGKASALHKLGLSKSASDPQMGDQLYQVVTPAISDSPTATTDSQVNSAFLEQDRQLFHDPQKNAELSLEQVIAESPVPVHPHEVAKLYGGAAYSPLGYEDKKYKHILHAPEGADINAIAHEIGHAQFGETGIGHVLQHPVSRMALLATPAVSAALGAALPTAKSRAIGVLLSSLGLSAPALISEGVATYKGRQLLKDLGGTPEDLSSYDKKMLSQNSSYALWPLMSMGFGAAGGIARQHLSGMPKIGTQKLHDRLTFRGLNISIENRAGSYRYWTDSSTGEEGRTLQRYPYGYIRMTEGLDGDHVDCYIGPTENADYVYVITTNKAPDFRIMDEQKCMLGFSSAKEAKEVFLQHYNDPRFFRSMKALPFEVFKQKALATKQTTNKKIASNMYEADHQRLVQTGIGSFDSQVPGDDTRLPFSSLVGMRSIVGAGANHQDKNTNAFHSLDLPFDVTGLDEHAHLVPTGPEI